jgi:hypothetical protein
MNVGGFFDFLGAVLAIAACTTLVFSVLGAAFGVRHGAQQGDTRSFKVAAMLCGCVGGVVVAAIVGLTVLCWSTDGMVGLMASLALAAIIGCAVSYGVARAA